MAEQVFVARERELAQLQAFLDRALAGNGQVCFVTGEAGAGKTALVTEFTRRAQAQHDDLLVAVGDCNAQTGIGDPYLPFREVLGLLTGDVEAKLAQGAITPENANRLQNFLRVSGQTLIDLGPDLIDVFVPGAGVATRAGALLAGKALSRGEASGISWLDQLEQLTARKGSGADSGPDQNRIFQQYTDVLQAMAQKRPLILTLDDLHWADGSSISLLFHLARRLGESRILIVGTYRPEDVAVGRGGPSTPRQVRDGAGSGQAERHPLEPVINELKRYHGDIWLELGQTAEVEGRQFVDALVDTYPNRLGESFRRALFQQTGGHPLFTLELLRDMRERGDLIENGAGQLIEGPDLDWEALPTRVEGVIEERVGRLDDDLRETLRVAGVEGEEFTAQVVARIREVDDRTLTRRLTHELDRQHRLIREQGVVRVGRQRLGRYGFRHALFQTYLYDSLGDMERMYLHEDVGTALEELYAERTGEIAVQLARHFETAGIADKAINYLLEAGKGSVRLTAYEEAIAYFTRGLELLRESSSGDAHGRQEFTFEFALAEAQWKAGQVAEAMAAFQQAAATARAMGSPENLARAALGFDEVRFRFSFPAEPAVRLLEEAHNALGEGDSILRVRVMSSLVRALVGTEPPERLAEVGQQAVEMARRIDDPVALWDALRIRILVHRQPEKIEERVAAADEMVRRARRIDDKERTVDALMLSLYDHLELGNIQAVDAALETGTRLAEETRQPFYIHNMGVLRVGRLLLAGRFEEAEQLAEETVEIGQRMGIENADGVFGMQMFTIRREQGHLRELAPVVKYFVERHSAAAVWRPGLALIYSDLGLEQEARTEFEYLAEDDFAGIPRDALWLTCVAYLSEVCAFLGDADRAATLYQFLLPYVGHNVVVGSAVACYGAASRYLGLLAATMSHWEKAEAHFEDALALNARMGARPWLAHTQHQYAAMLLERDQAGDRHKAMPLLDEALTTARELGMQALVEKVEAQKHADPKGFMNP